MSPILSRRALLAPVALATPLLPGCAAPPAEDAAHTPLAALARDGLVSLHEDVGGAPGAALGCAVALGATMGEGRVATVAHLLPAGAGSVWLRRGDGAASRAPVLVRGTRSDVALLGAPAGFLRPAEPCPQRVRAGDPLWAAGMPGLGPSIATGRVELPDAILPRFGRGFTAAMPARMGYSGGPVVGPDGRLRGLVCALPDGRGAALLAGLTGVDLDGLLNGASRRVFILSVAEVRAAGLA